MNDLVTSIIRTVVPTVVGAVLAWLLARGVTVDPATETQLTAALVALLTAVYYAAARLAESRWPAAGWLLGVAKQPAYAEPDAVAPREWLAEPAIGSGAPGDVLPEAA